MAKKIIVLTMYGKGESVDCISVGLSDYGTGYSSDESNALNYCTNINNLELNDNNWIYARIINENEKVILSKPPKFNIINILSDRSVQRIINQTKPYILIHAIKTADDTIKEKIFKNMTKNAASMLKEDMERLEKVDNDEVKSSRDKIIETIQRLAAQGSIVLK